MPTPDHTQPADLVWSISPPWRATVAECLQRWRSLPEPTRAGSFLVLREGAGARRTLAGAAIAELDRRLQA